MSVASALLLTLSQSPVDFGYVAVVALIPWLLATRHASAVEAVVLGVITGVVYGLASASWLVSAFESQGAFGLGAVLATCWRRSGPRLFYLERSATPFNDSAASGLYFDAFFSRRYSVLANSESASRVGGFRYCCSDTRKFSSPASLNSLS